MNHHDYVEVEENTLPQDVRFDAPRRDVSEPIEIAYGGFDRTEHYDGAPYKLVVDLNAPPATPARRKYFRRHFSKHRAVIGLGGDGFRADCACGWQSHQSWDRALVAVAADDHKRRAHLRSIP